ncbi:hypothetical protein TKK_0002623 [Trichogramma kaykai]|uniref:Uncharacterized protein n=1 Tax=Trichogramma kaykai TaxID=54128 RepID=A0ABD2WY03_9HYME
MKTWFGVVKEGGGGPTFHHHNNRMPVKGDANLIYDALFFGTILMAFLLIFPGVRKEKLSTFITVLLLILTGSTIKVSMDGSAWQTSTTDFVDFANSPYLDNMEIAGHIGLFHINITLKTGHLKNVDGDFEYNERFHWTYPHSMKIQREQVLLEGIPFPIVSLAGYFVLHDGFSWGRVYREAGYYATVMLWVSGASWCILMMLVVMVPHLSPYGMIVTGLCMMMANVVYWFNLPDDLFVAWVENHRLHFYFGWNYWLQLIVGGICFFVGILFLCVTSIYGWTFSTTLEVNHKAPYDRHTSNNRKEHVRSKSEPKASEEQCQKEFIRQVMSKLAANHVEDIECGTVNDGYNAEHDSENGQTDDDDWETDLSKWDHLESYDN